MYYIEDNNQIVLFDENKNKLETTIKFMPQYSDLEIKETDRPIILKDDCSSYIFADSDEYKNSQITKRQDLFNKEFFSTSLGYIRRNVNMANGTIKDFICDIVPALTSGLAQGVITPIITYKQPDFTQEITTEYLESLQEVKPINAEFLKECSLQLATDFMPNGFEISDEVTDEEVPGHD